MITEAEYKILCKCKDTPQPFDDSFKEEFGYLHTNNFLDPVSVRVNDSIKVHYRTNKVKGYLAIQEYEDRLNSIQTETRSLKIAEEQKHIAQEANAIADEANKIAEKAVIKANKANKISIAAIIVSAILSVISVVASVLIALFVKPCP